MGLRRPREYQRTDGEGTQTRTRQSSVRIRAIGAIDHGNQSRRNRSGTTFSNRRCDPRRLPRGQSAMPSSSTGTTVSNTSAGARRTRGRAGEPEQCAYSPGGARRRASWARRPRAAAGVPRRALVPASRSAGARWASVRRLLQRRRTTSRARASHDRVEHSPGEAGSSGRQLDRLEGCAAAPTATPMRSMAMGARSPRRRRGGAPASHRGAEYPSDHRDPRPAIEPDG